MKERDIKVNTSLYSEDLAPVPLSKRTRKTKEPFAPFNAKPDEMVIMNKVAAKIRELGMYTFTRWSFIFIAPPLCVTKEQIDEGLEIISEALKIADAAVV